MNHLRTQSYLYLPRNQELDRKDPQAKMLKNLNEIIETTRKLSQKFKNVKLLAKTDHDSIIIDINLKMVKSLQDETYKCMSLNKDLQHVIEKHNSTQVTSSNLDTFINIRTNLINLNSCLQEIQEFEVLQVLFKDKAAIVIESHLNKLDKTIENLQASQDYLIIWDRLQLEQQKIDSLDCKDPQARTLLNLYEIIRTTSKLTQKCKSFQLQTKIDHESIIIDVNMKLLKSLQDETYKCISLDGKLQNAIKKFNLIQVTVSNLNRFIKIKTALIDLNTKLQEIEDFEILQALYKDKAASVIEGHLNKINKIITRLKEFQVSLTWHRLQLERDKLDPHAKMLRDLDEIIRTTSKLSQEFQLQNKTDQESINNLKVLKNLQDETYKCISIDKNLQHAIKEHNLTQITALNIDTFISIQTTLNDIKTAVQEIEEFEVLETFRNEAETTIERHLDKINNTIKNLQASQDYLIWDRLKLEQQKLDSLELEIKDFLETNKTDLTTVVELAKRVKIIAKNVEFEAPSTKHDLYLTLWLRIDYADKFLQKVTSEIEKYHAFKCEVELLTGQVTLTAITSDHIAQFRSYQREILGLRDSLRCEKYVGRVICKRKSFWKILLDEYMVAVVNILKVLELEQKVTGEEIDHLETLRGEVITCRHTIKRTSIDKRLQEAIEVKLEEIESDLDKAISSHGLNWSISPLLCE